MSKKLYPESDIQNIANAIRALNGSTDTYTVSEMASAIALPENGYYLKQSASANPLTITDGQELNAQSCEVSFSPIQDLHGYDSPWIDSDEINNEPYLFRAVRGTATRIGNSLFDTLVGGTVAFNQLMPISSAGSYTTSGIAVTNNNDGTFTLNGTWDNNGFNYWILGGYNQTVEVFRFKANRVYLTSGMAFYSVTTSLVGGSGLDISRISKFSEDKTVTGVKTANPQTASQTFTNYKYCPMIIDLTAMFGSTIADYIYSLEQATAGSGVAYFRSLFPKDYYSYNAGQLMSVKTLSHKMVGFNQWDEEWEVGDIDATGADISSTTNVRSKNYIPVLSDVTYYIHSNYNLKMRYYDINKVFIGARDKNGNGNAQNNTRVMPSNCHYIKFVIPNQTTYNNDICINLHWDGERDGEYEAYEEHIYPLDSDLELRGIPKLDANNQLYYDGDTYESDGTVTRKYGVVNLGSLDWTYDSTNQRFGALVTGIKYTGAPRTVRFLIEKYTPIFDGRPISQVVSGDAYIADNAFKGIFIHDSNYTDSAAFKTAVTGLKVVFPLLTPTTETADTFTNPQLVDNWGTEEYTDSREVQIPVGHESYQANICEISGRTAINVYQSATSTTTADTTYTTQFTGTVYGATGDMVSGNWEGEWGYIASYNGETLPAEWMSDRDAYVSGTTPTTGAEVAYVLATPTEIVTAPKTIPLSENTNNFWTDGDLVQVKYFSKSL